MALPAVSAPLRAPATSTASIKILRFNAESDAEPTYRTYQVEVLMRDVGKEVVVEPLMGFRVIKDLVVDMEPFFAQYRSIFPYLINDTRPPERERVQSVEDREIFDDTTKCILCAACTTSCPSFWANEEFVGPAAIVNAHRFIFDSRDEGAAPRLARLNGREGVWRCRTIFNCTDACPR